MKSGIKHTIFLTCFLCSTIGFAQQYFKLLEKSDKPYEQKIARFSNGDLLIGGSPIRGVTANQNGGINLARLDACGKTVWSKNFQWKENFIAFKDFGINSANEAFVYGTAYENANEYIFILKLSPRGKELGFRMIHLGTVDNFTYNIEVLPSGQLLAYGLMLDFNTSKRGFLSVFDANLNLQWGKVFSPFESTGEAINTEDGGFLGRSGYYTYRLNATGDLLWATAFDSRESAGGYYPVAGPIAVQGGYIFEALKEDQAFFYKIDDRGQVLWKSELFKSTNRAADVQVMTSGDLLVVYNDPGVNENYPSQLTLSATGKISRQRRLLIAQSLQTDGIHQVLGSKGRVSIIGSQDLRAASADQYAGFVLQASLDSSQGTCFKWEDFVSTSPNNNPTIIDTQSVSFFPFNPRPIEAKMEEKAWDFAFAQSCDLTQSRTIKQDSALKCGQTWTIELPNTDFIWEDGTSAISRILSTPGTYRASDFNCIAPTVLEYTVSREACACAVYLPTAFSPNSDGKNDQLQLFSRCPIQMVEMSIYSRWGDRLFSTSAADAQWDGLIRQRPAAAGMYKVAIRYTVLNENGEMQEGTLLQNVQLLRD